MRQWAEALLWDRSPEGPDVFRMKGVLLVAGSPRQHLLQVLGAHFSIQPVIPCLRCLNFPGNVHSVSYWLLLNS